MKLWLICILIAVFLAELEAKHKKKDRNNSNKEPENGDQTTLTDEDFRRAKEIVVPESLPGDMDHIYTQNMYQGDIASSNFDNFKPAAGVPGTQQNAINGLQFRWPNAVIPYTISSRYTTSERAVIARAMQEYHDKTCIKFVARSRESDYLYISKQDGCWSYVGRLGEGRQDVSLANGCVFNGAVVHELFHAAGFFHEQSRNDRDEYIRVNFENVERGLEDQFEKLSLTEISHLGTAYDYGSVMHYDKRAFSRNGRDTITALKPLNGVVLGAANQLSDNDVKKINILYNCANQPTVDPSAPTTTTRPVVTEPPTTDCSDRSGYERRCPDWKRRGYCIDVRRTMERLCPKTCGFCDGGNGGDDGGVSGCSDQKSFCSAVTSVCTSSNEYLRQLVHGWCPKSCGIC